MKELVKNSFAYTIAAGQDVIAHPRFTVYGSLLIAFAIPFCLGLSGIVLGLSAIAAWGLFGALAAVPVTVNVSRFGTNRLTVNLTVLKEQITTHGRTVGKEYALMFASAALSGLVLVLLGLLIAELFPAALPYLVGLGISLPILVVFFFGQFTVPALIYNQDESSYGFEQSIEFCRNNFKHVLVFTLVRIASFIGVLALVNGLIGGVISGSIIKLGMAASSAVGLGAIETVARILSFGLTVATLPFGVGIGYIIYYTAGTRFYAVKTGTALTEEKTDT